MSATANSTGTPQITSYEISALVASMSCLLFLLVIMLFLFLFHHREPICCKVTHYQASHTHLDSSPQCYSSTQTLVGSQNLNHDDTHRQQSDSSLFLIGLPSSYGLPSLAGPRLPSYESVRKKDRQRHIHMLIAHRFGLNGPHTPEPPPSYEESLRPSVEIPCPAIGPFDSPDDNVIGSSEIPYAVVGQRHHAEDPIGSSEIPSPVTDPLDAPADTIGSYETAPPTHHSAEVVLSSEIPSEVIGPSHSPREEMGANELSSDTVGPLHCPSSVIGSSEVSSDDAIGRLESHEAIGPSEVPCSVTGQATPPSDATGSLEATSGLIGSLEATSGLTGCLESSCNGIGPVNTSSNVIGQTIVPSAATAVWDLPDSNAHTDIYPV
ncbi:uncharacterized protein si:ch73-364h19.1 [Engraulis encrasicolus]|uniref:uncharacterized protein si:ch73-364h19.1 n=1 Tax=Engraulis encrasicolus TaxID=184585 RepID=UPI002FD36051